MIKLLFLSILFTNCNKKQIEKICFYKAHIEETKLSKESLEKFESVCFENDSTISLINKSKHSNATYLWKGAIYAIAKYKNNEEVILKISRYGGFYKNLENGKVYYFEQKEDRQQWQQIVDTVIAK